MDSGFEVLDSGFFIIETWIPDSSNKWDPDSLSCIPDSKVQDSRFHKQNFPGFQNPESGFPFMGHQQV